MADFEDNTPKKVYFSRTISSNIRTDGWNQHLPFKASAIATVIDPNGKIAAVYDFSDISAIEANGKANVVIDIPYEAEGIWQFKFVSGENDDLLEIGLPEAKNWGVRGETLLGVTETTPKESYIYIPEKVDNLYVGSTNTDAELNVYDSDGKLALKTSSIDNNYIKSGGLLTDITEECIYKLVIPNKNDYSLLVDYAPSLMCPTKEMAENLKGGWIEEQGILVQGSIQRAARKLLVKYIDEKNFDVSVEKPDYKIGDPLEYPGAEAYMFGYYGPISSVSYMANKQILDKNSPYCGFFMNPDTPTWEGGEGSNIVPSKAFSELVNMDGQLNAFYHNDALINRTVLSVLAAIVSLSEDVLIKGMDISYDAPLTNGHFYFERVGTAYNRIHSFLSNEEKEILDSAMLQFGIKMANTVGYGPTNQWLYNLVGLTSTAYAADDVTLKNVINRHFEALCGESKKNKGISAAGYLLEDGGCDGHYECIGTNCLYEIYNLVEENDIDNEYLDDLKSLVQRTLEFYSYFLVTNDNGKSVGTNAATSRTEGDFGGDSTFSYLKVMDKFPLAKRRFEVSGYLNSDDKAMEHLKKCFTYYEKLSQSDNTGNIYAYNAYKNLKNAESTKLPFEYEAFMSDVPGIIAIKHKGLYMNILYTNPELSSVKAHSFMGGGISLLWGNGVNTVLASRKHKDYSKIVDYNQIMASCVFGKKNDGSIFITGKEKAALEWLEEGKKFKIFGTTPDGIDVSWTYTLEDDGIVQTVEADGDTGEMWINIPLSNGNPDAKIELKEGKLDFAYGGNCVTFSWNNDNGDSYIEEVDDIKCLRISMSNGSKTIKITNKEIPQKNDITIKSVAFSEDEHVYNVTLQNNRESAISFTLICAKFSESEELVDCDILKLKLDGKSEELFKINASPQKDENYIKIMVWDGFNSMYPYDIWNGSYSILPKRLNSAK